MTDAERQTLKIKLIKRLTIISPMPDDANVTQEQLDERFDITGTIHIYFLDDPDFVGPLLDSFGCGDGFGGYSSDSHYFYGLKERDFVLSEIGKRLQNGTPGSKMWSLYLLAELHKSGQEAIENEHELLRKCLKDKDHDLIRREAAHCLGALGDKFATEILKTATDDPCEEVKANAISWLKHNEK